MRHLHLVTINNTIDTKTKQHLEYDTIYSIVFIIDASDKINLFFFIA